MKLRTLKNLDEETQKKADDLKDCPASVFLKAQILGRRNLRQEAIKWIKELRKGYENRAIQPDLSKIIPYALKRDSKNIPDWRGHLLSVEVFIKHFFNIKESEIK